MTEWWWRQNRKLKNHSKLWQSDDDTRIGNLKITQNWQSDDDARKGNLKITQNCDKSDDDARRGNLKITQNYDRVMMMPEQATYFLTLMMPEYVKSSRLTVST